MAFRKTAIYENPIKTRSEKITQNSQQQLYAETSFYEICSPTAYSFIKKETLEQMFFCKVKEIFLTRFYRTPPGVCF